MSNGNLLLQIADEEVKLKVHYGGTFLWNPSLEYFGGKVEIMYRDPSRLSYFEIKGICEKLGIDEPCRVHYLGPVGNLEQDLRLIEDDQDVIHMWKPIREGQKTPSYCMWRVVMLHLQLKFLMVEGLV